MHSHLLSASEVQDLLEVDRSTIYRMASDGRLPAVKVGRQWRFPAREIESLFDGVPTSSPRFDPEVAHSIVEVMAGALGVQMMVTDVNGTPITPISNPCEWFAQRTADAEVLATCTDEWRVMADDLDFAPRFRLGSYGFECARSFIRAGSELVGMVLAGGVAPIGSPTDGFHKLDERQRHQVLDLLPAVGALVSLCAVRPQRSSK